MHINVYELIFRVAHVGPAQSCRGIIVGRGLTSWSTLWIPHHLQALKIVALTAVYFCFFIPYGVWLAFFSGVVGLGRFPSGWSHPMEMAGFFVELHSWVVAGFWRLHTVSRRMCNLPFPITQLGFDSPVLPVPCCQTALGVSEPGYKSFPVCVNSTMEVREPSGEATCLPGLQMI
jgi:hypothetical protein